jgi:putative redox protein
MVTSSTCTFPSPRGHELAARLERPDGPVRATAVFAHCFTCSKDLRAARRIQRALADRGIAVLSFDFTGLGASGGEFAASSFRHDVEDLVGAAAHLTATIAAPTLLVGHSLGGAAVLHAAARIESVRAVATLGAPADVSHVTEVIEGDLAAAAAGEEVPVTIGGRRFTVGPTLVNDLREHRLLDGVARLDAALLVLHAPRDATVGIDNARLLFEAARHPKSFVSLDSADHLLTDRADADYAAEVIATWAARYLPDEPVTPAVAPDGAPATTGYDDARVVATNTGGLATDVATRGFHLRVDEPADVGGTETGPTPYEHLGVALAACTSMTLRMYADRKQLPLDRVTTTVTFSRVHATDCAVCEHTDGRIDVLHRVVELHGELDDAQRAALLRIADRCPVHRTLEGQLEVHTTPAA